MARFQKGSVVRPKDGKGPPLRVVRVVNGWLECEGGIWIAEADVVDASEGEYLAAMEAAAEVRRAMGLEEESPGSEP